MLKSPDSFIGHPLKEESAVSRKEETQPVVEALGAGGIEAEPSTEGVLGEVLAGIKATLDTPEGQALSAKYRAREISREDYQAAMHALLNAKKMR